MLFSLLSCNTQNQHFILIQKDSIKCHKRCKSKSDLKRHITAKHKTVREKNDATSEGEGDHLCQITSDILTRMVNEAKQRLTDNRVFPKNVREELKDYNFTGISEETDEFKNLQDVFKYLAKKKEWRKILFNVLLYCCFDTVAHNCHGNNKYLTAKTKVSRQYQIPHGKTKMFTAITNTSRQKKKLTAKPKSSRQNQKLTAKPKSSRQNEKLTAKAKPEKRCFIRGSWTLILRAKAVGVKSNMAASLSSQMFCSNCGAEAVPTGNFCIRCGQGNRVKVNK